MLYKFPRLSTHVSYRLNRNLIYFFSKLRKINENSVFNMDDYFSSDFRLFLLSDKQETLRSLFETFFNDFKHLPEGEKTSTIRTFIKSQNIAELVNDATINCTDIKLNALSQNITNSTSALFKYLFSTTLNSFGKLAGHYKLIFDSLESNICPFCGVEMLNRPTIIRQDYDHMLLQSQYIFSTVNMDNLVPTGTECNRINKHSVDAIHFEGDRTVFNSPYLNSFDVKVSLTGSEPPKTLSGNGQWVINITPDNDLTRQWAYVYNIKQRYSDNVLHKFYGNWLKELRTYLKFRNITPIDFPALETELSAQSNTMISLPTASLANIVKGAFYKFLIDYNNAEYRASILNYINN